jgi:hypothetical protein
VWGHWPVTCKRLVNILTRYSKFSCNTCLVSSFQLSKYLLLIHKKIVQSLVEVDCKPLGNDPTLPTPHAVERYIHRPCCEAILSEWCTDIINPRYHGLFLVGGKGSVEPAWTSDRWSFVIRVRGNSSTAVERGRVATAHATQLTVLLAWQGSHYIIAHRAADREGAADVASKRVHHSHSSHLYVCAFALLT